MLGADLKVSISLSLAQVPRSFLVVVNLGNNVILYLSMLKYVKVRYLSVSLFGKGAQENVPISRPGWLRPGLAAHHVPKPWVVILGLC